MRSYRFVSFVLLLPLIFAAQAVRGNQTSVKGVDERTDAQKYFEIWEQEYAKSSDPAEEITPERMRRALSALRRSAELDHPEGLHTWAMYLDWPRPGVSNPEANPEKIRLLKRAVELGSIEAHVPLGMAYGRGEGVAKSPVMYVYHHCVAARHGDGSAKRNLETATIGPYAEFKSVLLERPVPFHARPDFKRGGVSFLRGGEKAWEIARFQDGWTALYVEEGCRVGFVETTELTKAMAATSG